MLSPSISGVKYDEKYAAIAESRFNYGPLAGHGQALIDVSEGPVKDGDKILEIGCSTGLYLDQLTNTFTDKKVKIVGIDINPDALKKAQERHEVSLADAQYLPIENGSIKAIYSLHTFEHIPDLGKAFREMERVLAPGGKAYMIVPPNMYGLETLRVAKEDLPPEKMGKGMFGEVKTWYNAWQHAKKLHCSNLGGPLGGARNHAENILKENGVNLKVSGGMRRDISFSNLLIFEKPAQQELKST